MPDSEMQQLAKTDRNPVQETRYQELLKGSGGSSGSSGGGSDLAGNAAQLLAMYQKANEPAIASLQASKPETAQKYEQTGQYLQKQVGSLDQRYADILATITGSNTRNVQAATTNTSQELGRRGISAEGGLFGKTIADVTRPIEEVFQGQAKELGFTRTSALDSLMNMIQGNTQSGVESQRAIQNAIAQLQSGAGQSSVTGALQLQQQQQAQAEAQAQRDLQLQIAQMGQTTDTGNPYMTLGEGGTLIDTRTGQIVYTAPKTSVAGGSGGGSTYYGESSSDGFVPLTTQIQYQYGGSSKIKK